MGLRKTRCILTKAVSSCGLEMSLGAIDPVRVGPVVLLDTGVLSLSESATRAGVAGTLSGCAAGGMIKLGEQPMFEHKRLRRRVFAPIWIRWIRCWTVAVHCCSFRWVGFFRSAVRTLDC